MSDRLYLLDSLYHTFRAFHALPSSLKDPQGRPSNAVHGFLGFLKRLLHAEKATRVLAVFEQLTGIFREELYPEYKATRLAVEPELLAQVPTIAEMCRRLGVATLEVDGFEADDVMATIARQAVVAGVPATIVSNDKDLAQVLHLDGDLEMLLVGGASPGDTRIRAADVPGRYGVTPDLVPSLLALRGDAVDNIKGLPGVGPKTAAKLLAEHGPLTALLEVEPARLKPTLRDALAAHRARLIRDLEIATVRYDTPVGFERLEPEQFRLKPIEGAAAFFETLGMRRAADEFRPLEGTVWAP